jgi:rhodanese-related sulfurtransferase
VTVPGVGAADLPAGATLLDVREHDEWAAGHAPDATHVPLGELAARLGDVPSGDPLFVICRSGGRSARAAGFLLGQGRQAVNVEGGMQAWAAAGRPMAAAGDAPPEVI